MDFDDSCYFVNHIDDCVSSFVQDSLLKDELGDMLEEEPLGGIDQEEGRKESNDQPPPKGDYGRGWSLKKEKITLARDKLNPHCPNQFW